MVGPKYHRPVVQAPNTFRGMADNPQIKAQSASYADLPWWQVFKDPKLQELIRTALKQNYDLDIATERINAARAQLAVTRSSLFPQVGAGANFNGGKENAFQSKYNFLTLSEMLRFSWISSAAYGAPPKLLALSCWLLTMRDRRLS